MRRILLAGAMAVGLLALPACSAGAATTIGQSGASSDCSGPNYGYVQDSPPASIPSDGVITSFTGSSTGSGQQVELLILAPVSGTTYHVVAKSGLAIFTASGVQNFPTRLSVQAGELIGQYGMACALPASGANFHYFTGAEPAIGTDQAFPFAALANHVVDLSASLEPDCNHDGFGDETQESSVVCPTGQRTAALKKCKKRHSKRARRKCRKKASLLPV